MTARDRGCETCGHAVTDAGEIVGCATARPAAVNPDECLSWKPRVQPPHPLLALQARLLEDAAQADRDAGTYERGSYYAGRYHGEAAALRRAAGEIAAMAKGDE